MSFTTSLIVKFASAQIPTAPVPVDAQLWRVATIISDDGATDSENLVETIRVSLSGTSQPLSSSFTFSNDLSPFATTKTDFGVVTIQVPTDAGFLFRSDKLTENPVTRRRGSMGLAIGQGQRTESLSDLQGRASSRLPLSIPNLPPGFTGTISGVTTSLVTGAINLSFTGSISPPPPPPPPPGAPALSAPPPVNFTLTTSLVVFPSKYLHDATRMVDVSTSGGTPTITFSGSDLPSNVVSAILNFFGAAIAGEMANAVAALAQRSVDNLVNGELSNVNLGDELKPGRTACVQRVTITSSGMAIVAAIGAFIEIPPVRMRGSFVGTLVGWIRGAFTRPR